MTRHMIDRSAFASGLALATLALFAGCDGKGAAGTCTTYGACGGEPMGNWNLVSGCENLVVSPYQQPSLPEQLQQPQFPTIEPPQPQPTTSGDWCSQLVYEPSVSPSMPIKGVVLWHGPASVSSGYLHANMDGTYDAEIQFNTAEHTYFANACLTRFENKAPTCMQFGMDLVTYLASQPSFKFDPTQPACTGDSSVGCDCKYDYQVQSPEQGTWHVDPANTSTVVFAGTVRSEPRASSFCQATDSLELSGLDGTSLFGATGVRSAKFVRSTP
jgi:hypothetical protein